MGLGDICVGCKGIGPGLTVYKQVLVTLASSFYFLNLSGAGEGGARHFGAQSFLLTLLKGLS